MNDTLDKLMRIEELIGESGSVELWIFDARLVINILLENTHGENGQGGVE